MNEITELRRQGLSVTQIGTLTGFDRKTIRKYLDDPQRPPYPLSKCAHYGLMNNAANPNNMSREIMSRAMRRYQRHGR